MHMTRLDTVTMNRGLALSEVNQERNRQEAKWGQQNHDDPAWNAILGEEVGEVSKSLNENDTTEHLVEELIQVAAVCVSWVEAIWRRPVTPPRKTLTEAERGFVFDSLGAASACWERLEKAGIFDSGRALRIGDELVAVIEEALNRG